MTTENTDRINKDWGQSKDLIEQWANLANDILIITFIKEGLHHCRNGHHYLEFDTINLLIKLLHLSHVYNGLV